MRKNLVVSLSYLIVVAWGCLPTLSNRMGVAIASSNNSVAVAKTDREPPQQQPPTGQQIKRTPIQQSKRLKIEIDVTSPGDLLVKEGQAVTAINLLPIANQNDRFYQLNFKQLICRSNVSKQLPKSYNCHQPELKRLPVSRQRRVTQKNRHR